MMPILNITFGTNMQIIWTNKDVNYLTTILLCIIKTTEKFNIYEF